MTKPTQLRRPESPYSKPSEPTRSMSVVSQPMTSVRQLKHTTKESERSQAQPVHDDIARRIGSCPGHSALRALRAQHALHHIRFSMMRAACCIGHTERLYDAALLAVRNTAQAVTQRCWPACAASCMPVSPCTGQHLFHLIACRSRRLRHGVGCGARHRASSASVAPRQREKCEMSILGALEEAK